MRRRLLSLLLALCLVFSCAPAAFAADPRADLRTRPDFYDKQKTSVTCTLASAAMMLRRRAYIDGLDNWQDLTETRLRRVAWSYVGLSHEFSMNGITVRHGTFDKAASTESQLAALLQNHPEGIVVYNKSVPHAILVTDYANGVFYCSDPSTAAPSGRYPVEQSTISIGTARYYWYVSSDINRPEGIGGSLTASGIEYPTRLKRGDPFALCGRFTSPGTLVQVRAAVRNSAGAEVQTAVAEPQDYSYDLSALSGLDFAALAPGNYTLTLTADDSFGGRISLSKPLLVGTSATQSAGYSGSAPVLRDVNAVNLVQSGFDVECNAEDLDGGTVSVIYSAWADGRQFAPALLARHSGSTFSSHVDVNASLLGISSFLINVTVMDSDGNSCRGSLQVQVGLEESEDEEGALVAEQRMM